MNEPLEMLQSVDVELSESQYKLADRTVTFNIYVFVLYNLLPHIAKALFSAAFGFILRQINKSNIFLVSVKRSDDSYQMFQNQFQLVSELSLCYTFHIFH